MVNYRGAACVFGLILLAMYGCWIADIAYLWRHARRDYLRLSPEITAKNRPDISNLSLQNRQVVSCLWARGAADFSSRICAGDARDEGLIASAALPAIINPASHNTVVHRSCLKTGRERAGFLRINEDWLISAKP
ncbi:MAG: hypothetical protein PHP45_06465 [Elusimicrobiales bacterium]|nr:hypothetical protein [Elusimicrobiales bacterium]